MRSETLLVLAAVGVVTVAVVSERGWRMNAYGFDWCDSYGILDELPTQRSDVVDSVGLGPGYTQTLVAALDTNIGPDEENGISSILLDNGVRTIDYTVSFFHVADGHIYSRTIWLNDWMPPDQVADAIAAIMADDPTKVRRCPFIDYRNSTQRFRT